MNDINKKTKIYFPIRIDKEKAKNHKVFNIKGIQIYFPYDPYPLQKAYMEKVILTLNKKGSISALESPTGTGKTLCLLCAVLGWMQQTGNQISIYYCTRTVSQINNVLKELKKTCYILQYSFLASRVFTCLKFDKEKRIKMDSQKLNDNCQKFRDNIKKIKKEEKYEEKDSCDSEEILINKSKFKFNKLNAKYNKKKNEKKQELEICKYYIEEDKFDLNSYNNIEDIEDLLKEGKEKKFCPYFYNLSKTKKYANLTFMTYNYILDPKIRKRINIFENNSIVILDEAHNICNILENLFSKKLKIKELEKIQKLLQIILDFINENRQEYYNEDELSHINPLLLLDTKEINNEINIIKNFLSQIKKFDFERIKLYKSVDLESNKNIYICDLEFFKEKFKDFQIEFYSKLQKTFSDFDNENKKDFNEFYENHQETEKKIKLSSLIKLPNQIFEFLKLIKEFPPHIKIKENDIEKDSIKKDENKNKEEELYKNSFRFIFSPDEEKTFFQIVCFDASYGLKLYQEINPYSTILTSGTLSIDLIENLLNIKFTEKLRNNHVIKKKSILH